MGVDAGHLRAAVLCGVLPYAPASKSADSPSR